MHKLPRGRPQTAGLSWLGRCFQTRRGFRPGLAAAVAVTAGLVSLNLIAYFTPANSWAATIPAGALMVFVLAKLLRLSWQDLGVAPASAGRGLVYGAGVAAVVLGVVLIGLALPLTREFFLNENYASMRGALIAAFLVIPLTTVVPEELAFRGALHGALGRMFGLRWLFLIGSLLFGLWHVTSALHLTADNAGLSAVLGQGSFAKWAGVVLAVAATSAAGAGLTWLRHRTGSVIAPMAVHWAVNAAGAVAAAAAWQLA